MGKKVATRENMMYIMSFNCPHCDDSIPIMWTKKAIKRLYEDSIQENARVATGIESTRRYDGYIVFHLEGEEIRR